MSKKIPATIAIVDDHALTRKTLLCRFASLGYNVVINAGNGKEFTDTIKSRQMPDLCVLGANMIISGAIETAIQMKKDWPGIKILFFSMLTGDGDINKLIEIGVDGVISKNASFTELKNAVVRIIDKMPHRMTAAATG
jgi:DNA-binding NarL/FixJ family response regulator